MVNRKVDRSINNDPGLIENQQIAKKFVDFQLILDRFTSVGIKLANKIQSLANSCRKFLPKRVFSSIFLEPPRYNKIYNAIHQSFRL